MKITLVPVGTKVEYHGSLKGYHGEMTVQNFSAPIKSIHEGDVIRYQLKYGPEWTDYLTNVRPESFTVITES